MECVCLCMPGGGRRRVLSRHKAYRVGPSIVASVGSVLGRTPAHATRRMWPCFQVPCPAAQLSPLDPPRGSTCWRNTSPRRPHWSEEYIVLGSWEAGDWLTGTGESRSGIDERRATTQRYGYLKNCHLMATPDLQVPAPRPDRPHCPSSLREGAGRDSCLGKVQLGTVFSFFSQP